MSERTQRINQKFASHITERCDGALDEIEGLSDLTKEEKLELANGISTIYYRDETDNTLNFQLIKRSELVMASLGVDVVDWLIDQFEDADAESAEHFARAVGKVGPEAINKVVTAFLKNQGNSYVLINLLTTLGSFRDPKVIEALPHAFQGTESSSSQVRAAAHYCMGRIANRVAAGDVDESVRSEMFNACYLSFGDMKPLVRRHGARAIGKLIKNSYLNEEQVDKANKAYRAILGMDGYELDDAYIVRNEAEHCLHILSQ